jgi:hypothetical protein
VKSPLSAIRIPSSVQRIGEKAFQDCESLAIVEFEPNSQLGEIDACAFWHSGLRKIRIPMGVINMDSCFLYCTHLTEAIFEPGIRVRELSKILFCHCRELLSIVIPVSVVTIGDNCFQSCLKPKSVLFEEGSAVTSLGKEAFAWTAMDRIRIPATVQWIGDECCSDTKKLNWLKFDDHSQLVSVGSRLFQNSPLAMATVPAILADSGCLPAGCTVERTQR